MNITVSPMEELFWEQWQLWLPVIYTPIDDDGLGKLVREHPIGRSRVDFALPELHLAIEIDGFDYHSSRDQLVADRRRQREIEAAGWRVIRFAGSEIRRDAESCVLDVFTTADRLARERRTKP